MRYKRALTNDQLKYLLDHSSLTNQELADQLGITKEIVASYKSRARKVGVAIPYQKRQEETIADDIKKIVETAIPTA